MRTTGRNGRRVRTGALAAGAVVVLGALSGCETVAPPTSDQNAPALISVVGKPGDQAQKQLEAAGYRVAVVNQTGDSIAASADRLVTEERPVGGTKLARGRTVTITLGR